MTSQDRPSEETPGVTRFQIIVSQFRLDGEDIIRLATGVVVRFTPQRRGYGGVTVRSGSSRFFIEYHRLKYALALGWLPPEVDHKNRTKSDNRLENLRAATRSQNSVNRKDRAGVRKHRGKWQAYVQLDGKRQYLGTHSSPETAQVVADKARSAIYGEFYLGQTQRPYPEERPSAS